MESRVGELDLRVRAPAGRADAIVPVARDFVYRVLERCDALLEERAPGRLVFMRRLDMQWRVWARALGSGDEVEAVAAEMARALDDNARARTRSADESDEIAVFADEVDYRAGYLRAVSRQRADSWFFGPLLEEGPPPGHLLRREHRVLTEAVVLRLVADGLLEDVLSELPATAVAGLAAALDVAEPGVIEPEAGRATSPAQRALEAFMRSTGRESRAGLPAAASGTGAPASSGGEPAAPSFEAPEHAQEFNTRFGGLFYLLLPALELSLGEVLWMACVSETAVFTRIAEELIGADAATDPALRLFGCAEAATRVTVVSAEQHAEVAKGLLSAMVVALSRSRSPGLPSPTLSIAPAGHHRLLVATTAESPFAVFAWPADSADTLGEGLARFLALWPQSAPRPSGDPALSSLDRTGRIRTAPSASPPPWILLHEDLLATALLTQAAGSLALLFASRAGAADVTSPAHLVARHLAVPARIVATDEEMEIRVPMDRIDLAVRRAGLDRDPGWVPWLRKRVRFMFVGDDGRT